MTDSGCIKCTLPLRYSVENMALWQYCEDSNLSCSHDFTLWKAMKWDPANRVLALNLKFHETERPIG